MWWLGQSDGRSGCYEYYNMLHSLSTTNWEGSSSESPTRVQWLEVGSGLECCSNLAATFWCPSWGSWGELEKGWLSLWIIPSVSCYIACLHQICIILPFLNSRNACTWRVLMAEAWVPGEFWHCLGQLAAEKRFKGSKCWASGSKFSVQENWCYWLFYFSSWTNITPIIWQLLSQFSTHFVLKCHQSIKNPTW